MCYYFRLLTFVLLSSRMAVLVEFNKPFHDLESEQDVSFFFQSGKDSDSVRFVPTMDIWKKFELLPTPPRSPSRNSDSPVPIDSSVVADALQIVSDILDEDDTPTQGQSDKNSCSLRSKLIQDCMWNSHSYESLELELKALTCPEDLYETPCSTPPPVEYVSSDCVDPSTVFPYPINDTQSICSSHTSDSGE